MCCVPMSVPGGKPVTALPVLRPRSPVSTVGPVLVIVDDDTTAKAEALPSGGGPAADAGWESDLPTPAAITIRAIGRSAPQDFFRPMPVERGPANKADLFSRYPQGAPGPVLSQPDPLRLRSESSSVAQRLDL